MLQFGERALSEFFFLIVTFTGCNCNFFCNELHKKSSVFEIISTACGADDGRRFIKRNFAAFVECFFREC